MKATIEEIPRITANFAKPARTRVFKGGRGCVHPDTLIDTPSGQVAVKDWAGGVLWSYEDGRRVRATSTAAYPCTVEQLYEVTLGDGRSIKVTDHHKFLTTEGWMKLCDLRVGSYLIAQPLKSASCHPRSNSELSRKELPSGDQHSTEKHEGFLDCCSEYHRQCDQQLRFSEGTFPIPPPSRGDAQPHSFHALFHWGVRVFFGMCILSSTSPRPTSSGALTEAGARYSEGLETHTFGRLSEQLSETCLCVPQFPQSIALVQQGSQWSGSSQDVGLLTRLARSVQTLFGRLPCVAFGGSSHSPCLSDFTLAEIVGVRKHARLTYWDLHVYGTNNYISNGIVNHNSGKTRGIAKRSALRVYQLAEAGVEGVFLASREHLNSLDESSMEEIKAAIRSEPWLHDYFEVGEKYIRTKNRRISYAFAGLRHNLDSIKSKARIIGNWTDEGESVSDAAWRKLIPTIREEGAGWVAENWITYNPESPDSATHRRFVENKADDCIVTTLNYEHNPWFPDLLDMQRLEDKKYRPETYDHTWLGAFLTLTDAQVFAGKSEVAEFEPEHGWDGPYFGMDFGFAQDPTVAGEQWVHDNTLYIRRESSKIGLELDDTAAFITDAIPDIDQHTIRADSARPESISYLRRHGLPRVEGVKKWAGSVEDGIEFIKSFRKVVIHPDCPGTAREFRLYSYKVDRLSGDIMPVIVDANNHHIDQIRYALVPLMKSKQVGRLKVRY